VSDAELTIRSARPEDLADVIELTRADSLQPVGEPGDVTDRQRAAFAEIDADPHQDLLVGIADGRVVATAQVTWLRVLMADGGLYCQVEAVRTAAGARGRGHGTRLMAAIEEEAIRRGAARIQLTSNRERLDAHRFYERLGYTASHVGMKKYLR
jgi:GNAT superfamily N-acetyltransferase